MWYSQNGAFQEYGSEVETHSDLTKVDFFVEPKDEIYKVPHTTRR